MFIDANLFSNSNERVVVYYPATQDTQDISFTAWAGTKTMISTASNYVLKFDNRKDIS